MTDRCRVAQCRCLCDLPIGHETPHVCNCGGSFAHHGEELWVYALPTTMTRLTDQECIELANRVARGKPLFIEERDQPFSVSREPIEFFRVPTS